jgi:hypothetical protein
MRRVAATLFAVSGLWFARGAHAQDARPAPTPAKPPPVAATPDLDFLEYLGAWQENDEEWLVSEQWQKDRAGADRKRAADKADGKKPGQARNDDDESK